MASKLPISELKARTSPIVSNGLTRFAYGAVSVYLVLIGIMVVDFFFQWFTGGPSQELNALHAATLSGSAIIVSAGIAALVARRAIYSQRAIARRNMTINLISQRIWDKDYIQARNLFNQAKNSREGLEYWGDNVHHQTDTVAAIRDVLNDYEIMAIGIQNGIVDNDIYKEWTKTTLVEDYEAARTLIAIVQHFAGTQLYVQYQALALKWAREMGRTDLDGSLTKKQIEQTVRDKQLSWLKELKPQ